MFDRLANLVYDKVGKDGLLHFAVTSILTALFNIALPWWGAAFIVFVVSLWKELMDTNTTGFSWKDLACDLAGIVVGL